ncbi:MAG: hypothetical protein CBD15_001570, partial [Synechococcus sp. TMED155]
LIVLLSLLGVCGLVRLPLMPPLLARSGSGITLSDLEAQEALEEARQAAASQMSRFVGGQITRHYWGGFTPYFDVLGLEIPPTMAVDISVEGDRARLVLDPRRVNERYVAEVVRSGTMARGAACRGNGEPGPFVLRGKQLLCPEGWVVMNDPLLTTSRQVGSDTLN